MRRRNFIAGATSAIALAPESAPVWPLQKRQFSKTTVRLPLRALHDQYRSDLFTDFLPFMEKYVIDTEFGGFLCNTDPLGKRLDNNKLSWFEGRGTWVDSFLRSEESRGGIEWIPRLGAQVR